MGFTNGFAYDAMRRLTDSYDALGRHTHSEYCTCGALESVTDATGTNLTTFTHDAAGRRLGVTGPDGYWVTNGLNALGQVITTRDSGEKVSVNGIDTNSAGGGGQSDTEKGGKRKARK